MLVLAVLLDLYGLKVMSIPNLCTASLTRPACMSMGKLLNRFVSTEGLMEGKWRSCTRVDCARDQEGVGGSGGGDGGEHVRGERTDERKTLKPELKFAARLWICLQYISTSWKRKTSLLKKLSTKTVFLLWLAIMDKVRGLNISSLVLGGKKRKP